MNTPQVRFLRPAELTVTNTSRTYRKEYLAFNIGEPKMDGFLQVPGALHTLKEDTHLEDVLILASPLFMVAV